MFVVVRLRRADRGSADETLNPLWLRRRSRPARRESSTSACRRLVDATVGERRDDGPDLPGELVRGNEDLVPRWSGSGLLLPEVIRRRGDVFGETPESEIKSIAGYLLKPGDAELRARF